MNKKKFKTNFFLIFFHIFTINIVFTWTWEELSTCYWYQSWVYIITDTLHKIYFNNWIPFVKKIKKTDFEEISIFLINFKMQVNTLWKFNNSLIRNRNIGIAIINPKPEGNSFIMGRDLGKFMCFSKFMKTRFLKTLNLHFLWNVTRYQTGSFSFDVSTIKASH